MKRCAAGSPTRKSQIRFARTLSEVQAIEIDCFIHHENYDHPQESEQAQSHQAGELQQPR